jgi:hypothetical protein
MTLAITTLPCGDTQIACDTAELLPLLQESLPCLQELPPETEKRLFPPPSANQTDLNQDWRAFVLPDLHTLFQSQQDTVRADLRRANATPQTIHIPQHHLEAWIHTLNQARLHLFASHSLHTDGLQNPDNLTNPEQKLAALKIHLYALLQEKLIKSLRPA